MPTTEADSLPHLAWLDEQPFYEVMQAYRHSGTLSAAEAFEAVKDFIRAADRASRPSVGGEAVAWQCRFVGAGTPLGEWHACIEGYSMPGWEVRPLYLAAPSVPADRRELAEEAKRLAQKYAERWHDARQSPSRENYLDRDSYCRAVISAIDALAAPSGADARDGARLDALSNADVLDRLDFGRDGWVYADKFGAWHYGTPRECIDAAMAPPPAMQGEGK